MATYIHTSVTVTGRDDVVAAAWIHARGLGLSVSSVVPGRNGFDSFLVAPSGSAGGLYPSHDDHADAVDALVDYLRPIVGLDWVAVRFGRELGRAEVLTCCGSAASRAAARWRTR